MAQDLVQSRREPGATLDGPGAEQRVMRTVFEAQRRWVAEQNTLPVGERHGFVTVDVETGDYASGTTRQESRKAFARRFGHAAIGTYCAPQSLIETEQEDWCSDLKAAEAHYSMIQAHLEDHFHGQYAAVDVETGQYVVARASVIAKAKFGLQFGDRDVVTFLIGRAFNPRFG